MPIELSLRSITASPASGVKNDGQPQCDSNFVSLRNSSAPHARHRYTPLVLVSVYSPSNAPWVPACRSTRYSDGVSCSRHSASDLTTFAGCSVSMRPGYVVSEPRRDDELQRVPDGERGDGQQQEHHGDRGEPPLALGAVHR